MAAEEYVEVIAPAEPDIADEQFRAWLADRAGSALSPSDVRIDVIRAVDGRTLRRYRVRAEVLSRRARGPREMNEPATARDKDQARLTLLDDARRRPELFVWNGGIDAARLDTWLQSRHLNVPGDLRFFWIQTGGGDFFESETVLAPSAPPARQMMWILSTRITAAGDCRANI